MREILFRGKRIDNGEWVEGNYGNHTSLDAFIIYKPYPTMGGGFAALGFYEVVPETVGQYTGLCDKRGKKMFEGDILATRTGRPHIVKFEDGGFALTDTAIPIRHANVFEIIGNIHDNPELLEG